MSVFCGRKKIGDFRGQCLIPLFLSFFFSLSRSIAVSISISLSMSICHWHSKFHWIIHAIPSSPYNRHNNVLKQNTTYPTSVQQKKIQAESAKKKKRIQTCGECDVLPTSHTYIHLSLLKWYDITHASMISWVFGISSIIRCMYKSAQYKNMKYDVIYGICYGFICVRLAQI